MSPRRRERFSSVMPARNSAEKPASADVGDAERPEARRGERDVQRGRAAAESCVDGVRDGAATAATLGPPRRS